MQKLLVNQSASAVVPQTQVPVPPRPPFNKTKSFDNYSILKSMQSKKQAANFSTPPSTNNVYTLKSLESSSVNLLENDLSSASVEDFFYHHPKLRISSNAVSQLSSGTSTPALDESESSTKQHPKLMRSAISGSNYIQPLSRVNSPPLSMSSAVVDPTKKIQDLSGSMIKAVNRSESPVSVNASLRAQPYPKSSLSKGSSFKNLSVYNNRSGDSVPYDDIEVSSDSSMTDVIATENVDYKEKITPYGGFSKPDIQLFKTREKIFEKAPFEVIPLKKGNGSLRNAIKLATDNNSKEKIDVKWVGTLGMPSDELPISTRERIAKELKENYKSESIFVDDLVFQGHYKSFCKQILWPALHYQIADHPKSKVFEQHSWGYYKKVCEIFAERIVSIYKEGDIIWIHDYHLLLLPQLIREKLPNAKIGFFLHVSFPSSEVFRCFAQREKLLQGMLGANVISFQTEEYVRHFLQTCNKLLLSDFNDEGIKYDGRTIAVNHIPVGIDAPSLRTQLQSEEIAYWRKMIKERWPNKKLIVSRDKMDKIRGIKQKLLAYELFLADNPEYLDNIIFIQICLPAGGIDEDLEFGIMTVVDRINSKSHNISIAQPVVFLNQDIDFEQYLALLCEADTFIVSAMREGMNLTSHEFVVSTNEKHSPLILSEFTGSASILGKDCILINPWDIRQISEGIRQALSMKEDEKLRRWKNLYDIILKNDSKNWVKDCLKSIKETWEFQQQKLIENTSYLTKDHFHQKYYKVSDNGRRFFILNLENLASSFTYQGSKLVPVDTNRIFKILNNLTSDPMNAVYVMSYYKRDNLLSKYRRVPNLGLISENGGYIKLDNSNYWISIIDEKKELKWMPSVIELSNSIVERLPGSYIEIEDCTIRFHTENVKKEDYEHKIALIGDLMTHINDLFQNENVHATLVDEIVIIQEVDLPIRSLQFILNSLNKARPISSPVGTENFFRRLPSSNNSSPISQPEEELFPESNGPVRLLCILGGQTPTDENLFKYGMELYENRKVDDLLSVNVGKIKRTFAQQNILGVNELFNILNSV
ncbi:hypothetical protein PACTADRAFT_50304 [Pachysolen tannophilus NRRL Y-2460]|uniref:Uncharacterized protein n=1 Tax=Pachysolen tannophilus NRRL Y-2460 TaxID=669874 RepID=A0A1E4TV57_PACTA|nr:hypothetical protein PACTADRAFT_50304 [Pachysolen tannophilus NRRL Y-2460]